MLLNTFYLEGGMAHPTKLDACSYDSYDSYNMSEFCALCSFFGTAGPTPKQTGLDLIKRSICKRASPLRCSLMLASSRFGCIWVH